MKVSTGVYLTRLLRAYNVDTVFGIPGVHTIELYRGLAGSGIRHITPRHEQGAGFMADGYSRASGRPGVCFIISGPGMTNIITAMGQAYSDSVPMLVISAVNAHGHMGSGEGWLHELPNQSALVSNVAAFSRTVHRPEELVSAVGQAFAIFDGARPRPVHIELPIDVMLASADHLPLPRSMVRVTRPAPAPQTVASAAKALSEASAPVILAGGGAVGAAVALRSLAEALDAPLVMTTNGRGILPPDHPLGVSLSPSMAATRKLIAGADVVLAIGTELGPTDYDFYEDGGFVIRGTLIRADIDPAQIMRGKAPSVGLIGDARLTTEMLMSAVVGRKTHDGAARAAMAMFEFTRLPESVRGDLRLLELIRNTLPDALIVGDSTQVVYAGNTAFAAAVPGGYFNSATGFGTLGYGLPAAIGACVAGDRPVVALSGDGGIQFSLGELASAAELGVPLTLLLHVNNGYAEIKSCMIAQNVPPLGVDIFIPDLAAIAEACGWRLERLERVAELPDMLIRGAAASGPTLIVFDDDLREKARESLGPERGP